MIIKGDAGAHSVGGGGNDLWTGQSWGACSSLLAPAGNIFSRPPTFSPACCPQTHRDRTSHRRTPHLLSRLASAVASRLQLECLRSEAFHLIRRKAPSPLNKQIPTFPGPAPLHSKRQRHSQSSTTTGTGLLIQRCAQSDRRLADSEPNLITNLQFLSPLQSHSLSRIHHVETVIITP
jgi:hypothetical protein